MCRFRYIKCKVKMYDEIVTKKPQKAKKHCNDYYQDVKKLKAEIKAFEEQQSNKFAALCEQNIRRWEEEEKGFFHRIVKIIIMGFERVLLNRYARNAINSAGLRKKLEYAENRLQQFIIWKELKNGT